MAGLIRKIFDHRGVPVLALIFAGLYVAETVSSLRQRRQRRSARTVVNAIVSVPGFIVLRLLLLPAMVAIARKRVLLCLNPVSRPNSLLRQATGFLMLDYSNYLWHILNHRIHFLWRFHLVHHTDADLDLTTAIRFHAGEIMTSLIYRSLAVGISGASSATVLVYEIFFEAATQFHHSNWRIPASVESAINKLFVTPRMHGIHHSIVDSERDANFSVIFSIWDRIHNTFNMERRQEEIVIGVPSYTSSENTSAVSLMRLPFLIGNEKQRGLFNR